MPLTDVQCKNASCPADKTRVRLAHTSDSCRRNGDLLKRVCALLLMSAVGRGSWHGLSGCRDSRG